MINGFSETDPLSDYELTTILPQIVRGRATGFLNANRMPLRCHEDIAVFYKSLPVYNPQMEIGIPSHSTGNGIHKQTNNCYLFMKHQHFSSN